MFYGISNLISSSPLLEPLIIASDDTMFGTGQLPKFENDQFEIKFEEGSGRKFRRQEEPKRHSRRAQSQIRRRISNC